MNRATRLTVGIAATTALAVGCATRRPAAEPVPAGWEGEADLTSVEDSVGTLLAQVVESVTAATDAEVEAEVREMFGEQDARELESEGPSWDIPITINESVERWLEYFQTDGRGNFAIYLSRAGRYESMMRAMFRDAGLPEDLVYVSLIESGFSPRAYSRARAVGLWQFISSTARRYGLQISYWVDERRDPILATKAAAAHLRDLYEEFGSWYLAAAAYNGGATRVRRSISRSGSDDFWTLSQRRYLPESADSARRYPTGPAAFGACATRPQSPVRGQLRDRCAIRAGHLGAARGAARGYAERDRSGLWRERVGDSSGKRGRQPAASTGRPAPHHSQGGEAASVHCSAQSEPEDNPDGHAAAAGWALYHLPCPER